MKKAVTKMDSRTFMSMFKPDEISIVRVDGKDEPVISAAGLCRVLPLIGTQEADALLTTINSKFPAI